MKTQIKLISDFCQQRQTYLNISKIEQPAQIKLSKRIALHQKKLQLHQKSVNERNVTPYE